RAAVDPEPAVRPRLLRGPAGGIDHVERVGVAPLVVVGVAEVTAVAGRAAEVDVEEREALTGDELLERDPAAIGLPRRATVRVDDGRSARRTALAGRAGRSPQRSLDAPPVARLERDPLARDRPVRSEAEIEDGRHRARDLAAPGIGPRDAARRSEPPVLLPRS